MFKKTALFWNDGCPKEEKDKNEDDGYDEDEEKEDDDDEAAREGEREVWKPGEIKF